MLCILVSKKSGISLFLVSAKNGAGVNKMTNIRYGGQVDLLEFVLLVSGRVIHA